MFAESLILMTRTTQSLCALTTNVNKEKCLEFHGRYPQPRILISDYELAILQAMAVRFPNAQSRGSVGSIFAK
jgi:hypothetical protein